MGEVKYRVFLIFINFISSFSIEVYLFLSVVVVYLSSSSILISGKSIWSVLEIKNAIKLFEIKQNEYKSLDFPKDLIILTLYISNFEGFIISAISLNFNSPLSSVV